MVKKRGIPRSEEKIEAMKIAMVKRLLEVYHLESNRPYNASRLSRSIPKDSKFGRVYDKDISMYVREFVERGMLSARVGRGPTPDTVSIVYSIKDVDAAVEYVTGIRLRAA